MVRRQGCAVGCTLEVYDHSRYPVELGIPEWLARAEDMISGGMTGKEQHGQKIFKIIPIGVNLDSIKPKFSTDLKHSIKSMEAARFDRNKFPAGYTCTRLEY